MKNSTKLYQDGRLIELDVLKAIALLAVVLYHAGVQTYGYLGVDIFLVINGYVVLRSLFHREESGESVSYLRFVCQKIVAFWPLLLLVGIVSLAVGFFVMLPDDYENLAESVVATNLFANNILMAITTKNYWAVINDYKPLMHTWYISVLMQSYFLLPIVPLAAKRLRNRKRVCGSIYGVITVASFALFISSILPTPQTFYYLPCRFFEITLGAGIACFEDDIRRVLQNCKAGVLRSIQILAAIGILTILLADKPSFENNSRLPMICLLTACFIAASAMRNVNRKRIFSCLMPIASVGRSTFSYYVWHQVILAFARYMGKSHFHAADILCYLVCVIIVGELSKRFVEKPLLALSKKRLFKTLAAYACICVISSAAALLIYVNAGVVRDVPELDIERNHVQRNMHSRYNERGNAYDADFTIATNKPKILIIGDSFGNDFLNVLLEADLGESVDLSRILISDPGKEIPHFDRIESADYIVLAFAESYFTELPECLEQYRDEGKVYIVGNKSFGVCLGAIYTRRYQDDYYQSSVRIDDAFLNQNRILQENYGDHLIDMITPVQNPDGTVRVFTDENKYISQDGKHLTQAGAQYYARLLDFSWLA